MAEHTAAGCAAALATGELTAVALAERYRDRIEELDPRLNSVLAIAPDLAEQAAASDARRAAGALLGPVYVISPQMGNIASLKAFAIVILGGLGSIGGATIGGFILAFAEEIGAGYISSGYRDAMGFVLIIAVLLFKPTGLFARSERIG